MFFYKYCSMRKKLRQLPKSVHVLPNGTDTSHGLLPKPVIGWRSSSASFSEQHTWLENLVRTWNPTGELPQTTHPEPVWAEDAKFMLLGTKNTCRLSAQKMRKSGRKCDLISQNSYHKVFSKRVHLVLIASNLGVDALKWRPVTKWSIHPPIGVERLGAEGFSADLSAEWSQRCFQPIASCLISWRRQTVGVWSSGTQQYLVTMNEAVCLAIKMIKGHLALTPLLGSLRICFSLETPISQEHSSGQGAKSFRRRHRLNASASLFLTDWI